MLGVARTADGDTIRQAYRRLARELHPDVSAEPKAEERFRELTGAYTVLSDPNARLLYDRFGYRGRGSGFSSARRGSSGTQVLAEVNVDTFEAARGARREVRYSSREQCQACHGKGSAPGSDGCKTCAGKGRLTRSATLRVGDWLQVEKCSDCNGTGFSEPCPECHGEGSLSQEQVVKVRIPAGVEDGNRLRMVGDSDGEQLLVQVRPLPEDSYLVLAARGGAPPVLDRPARLLSEPPLADSHSRPKSRLLCAQRVRPGVHLPSAEATFSSSIATSCIRTPVRASCPRNRREAKESNLHALRRIFLLTGLILGLAAIGAPLAAADTVGPITFEPPTYTTGDINGQNGWMKTGPYDVAVASVSSFPAAAGYGFGTQALRVSNAVTSGSFGDQTFSPGLSQAAGESGLRHFDSTFRVGTALSTLQPDLRMTVSPDDGNGGRMSFLRFEDQADGVHVFFADVTNPGPFPTVSNFNTTDIATISRGAAHTIRFSIDYVTGPGNDVVKIYVDGVLKTTGTTWENYYRYDPEQAGNGNVVPTTSKILIRESGVPAPLNLSNGFLVDGLSLASSTPDHDNCKFVVQRWSVHGPEERLHHRRDDSGPERLRAPWLPAHDHGHRPAGRALRRRGRQERRRDGERHAPQGDDERPRRCL